MTPRQVTPIGAPEAAPHLVGTSLAGVTGARTLTGDPVDLAVTAGTFAVPGAAPDGEPHPASGTWLDATGWIIVPAASDPHAHLDKALTADRIPPGSGNDLEAAVSQWHAIAPGVTTADLERRGRAAIARYVANGITSIRTHVNTYTNVDGADPLRAVDVFVGLREELRGVVNLQVCLLAGSEASDAVIAEGVAHGVDVVGGCPHLAPDPHRETTRMLDVAEKHGLPVDLHTDEQTQAHELDIVDLAEQVLARGLQQRVTASHCVRLGSLPPERLRIALDVVARAGLGIVTLPQTNLYLQGWDATHLMPRGLTAVRAILDAGILLAAGGDNLRDPFNPVGLADPFETTSLLMTAGHLKTDEALAAVTTDARTLLGLPPVGSSPGDAADFMLVAVDEPGDVYAGAVGSRVVVHGGRVIADTRTRRTLAPGLSIEPSRSARHATPTEHPTTAAPRALTPTW